MGWAKEAVSWTAVAIAAGLGNFLLGCYCGNYGGNYPPVDYIHEVEPNDSPETATLLGQASHVPYFDGECGSLTDEDYFRAAITSSGYVYASITVKEDGYDADLAVYGTGFSFVSTQEPLQASGTIGTGADFVFVHVTCNDALPGNDPVRYTGSIAGP